MSERFSKPVREMLLAAGWFDGRRIAIETISLPEGYSLFPKAEEALVEFGGLHVGESRRGVNCAACDVEFAPIAGTNLVTHIRKYEPVLGAMVYPLGYVEGKHCLLLIDDVGRAYLINAWLVPLARSLEASLERLLLGVRTDSRELTAGWGENARAEIHLARCDGSDPSAIV